MTREWQVGVKQFLKRTLVDTFRYRYTCLYMYSYLCSINIFFFFWQRVGSFAILDGRHVSVDSFFLWMFGELYIHSDIVEPSLFVLNDQKNEEEHSGGTWHVPRFLWMVVAYDRHRKVYTWYTSGIYRQVDFDILPTTDYWNSEDESLIWYDDPSKRNQRPLCSLSSLLK